MQVHVKNVEKVNEQILKKWCHQDTDRWADGDEFIGPSGTKKWHFINIF